MQRTYCKEFDDNLLNSEFREINQLISNLNDQQILTISKLFSISSSKPYFIRNYFQNIIIPKILVHGEKIKDFFLDYINNLEIISTQMPLDKIGKSRSDTVLIHRLTAVVQNLRTRL